PGNDPTELALVDLGGELREIAGAIVERFQRGRMIDNVALARAFYREFPDRYDALVVWTDFESDLDDAFAFASPVSNQVEGIGDGVFDDSAVWGSSGELESFVFMGDLRRYPRDPHARVFGAASRPTTLGLLSHEIGHRWLARARVFRTGTPTTVLLGRQSSHWSFFFDSDASFLEGNEIVQEEERRFRTAETVARYSRIDLYLMGLAAAAEVPPFFVVTEATASATLGDFNHESPPRVGVVITGTRTDLTMDDVELALGRRRPDFESSQKMFRHAWIFLAQRDTWPTAEDVARLQEIRNAFVPFFNEMTLGRGHLEIGVIP
ncbi:MAG TPA: hypothetical protein VEK15_31395, partial [Vicinamibacteria bacterium]|nr:hypothetical protein [Vicinamibacteria bacterium]